MTHGRLRNIGTQSPRFEATGRFRCTDYDKLRRCKVDVICLLRHAGKIYTPRDCFGIASCTAQGGKHFTFASLRLGVLF